MDWQTERHNNNIVTKAFKTYVPQWREPEDRSFFDNLIHQDWKLLLPMKLIGIGIHPSPQSNPENLEKGIRNFMVFDEFLKEVQDISRSHNKSVSTSIKKEDFPKRYREIFVSRNINSTCSLEELWKSIDRNTFLFLVDFEMHRVPPGLLFEPSSEAWRRFDPELCIPKSAETFNYDGKWPYAILCPDLTQFFNKETSPVLRYYQSHHIGPWNSKYDYYIYLFKGNPAYWKIRSHEILHGFSKGLEVALWSKNSDKSERT